MNPLITDNLDAIRALAQEYGVARLDVFGSACTGEFDDERSDVDFVVEYPPGYDLGPWGGRLQEFEGRLAALLGREVDLLTAASMRNKWVRAEAAKTRVLLYRDPGATDVELDQPAGEPIRLGPTSSLHPKAPKWLDDVQRASAFILEEVAGKTLADYKTDRWRRAVVERNLTIVGTALAGLKRVDSATASMLPDVQEFIDIGEHVIRDYDAVDYPRVWALITHSLSPLHSESERILRSVVSPA